MALYKHVIPICAALFLTACVPAALTNDPRSTGENLDSTEPSPVDTEVNIELLSAATRGDVEAVKSLLEQGAEVEASDANGVTPLIAAAYGNHLEAAKVLIEAGADVNKQDNTKQSAYLISTSDGYLELLQLTLAAGADVHSLDSYNGTGLIRAADRGHVEIITELLKTDIDIDHINRLGWTALLEAIILGDGGPRHTEVVRLLVEAGADVNQSDGKGVTPLEHARMRGFDEIAAILESVEPNITAPDPSADLNPTISPSPNPTTAPLSSPTLSPTPHPLFPFTIPGLRTRNYPGGQIRVRTILDQNASFSRQYVEYPSDNLTITGIMHMPTGAAPFPVLILLHGYIDRENYFAGADTWQAAEFFARQGYLVISPDLRSWGESDTGLSLFHTGLVVDVINLLASLKTLPEADTNKVGLWGHSMGGGIAMKVLAVADHPINAAVLYAPNSADDADLIARWGPGCLPGESQASGDPCNPAEIIPTDTPQDLVETYLEFARDSEFLQQVAPLYHIDRINTPVQIHIGSADGQFLAETPPQWSDKLADALQTAGKEVMYFSYPGQGHAFTGNSWTLFQSRALEFFNTYLQ